MNLLNFRRELNEIINRTDARRPREATLKLTKAEVDYLWLLTALDITRIDAIDSENERDAHYRVRHSLREKLFWAAFMGN